MLESLRRHISDLKYKHLKFITIKTNDKYNDYLKNKIDIDISCIPIDQQRAPDVGTLVNMVYETSEEKSVTHITTHEMLQPEHKLFVPNVYLLVTKTKDKHQIQAKIALERHGPCVLNFVSGTDEVGELVVKVINNFDLESIFE
jgi:hypothetical protein